MPAMIRIPGTDGMSERESHLFMALQEIASWEDEAPPRGERAFALMTLERLGLPTDAGVIEIWP